MKKYFLLGLVLVLGFLFIPIDVFAINSSYKGTIKYSTLTEDYYYNNVDKYNAVYEYLHITLNDVIDSKDLSSGNYIVSISPSSLATDSISITLLDTGYYDTSRICSFAINCIRNYYYNSKSYYSIGFVGSYSYTLSYSNGSIVSHTSGSIGNKLYSFNMTTSSPDTTDIIENGFTAFFMYQYVPNNTSNIYFEAYGVGKDIPLLQNNNTSYPTYYSNIFDLFYELNIDFMVSPPTYYSLGSLTTSSFSYKINDSVNGQSKPQTMKVVFDDDIGISTLDYMVNNNNQFTQILANSCSVEDEVSVCYFNFQYDVNNSNPLIFSFDLPSEYTFEVFDLDSTSLNEIFDNLDSEYINDDNNYVEVNMTNKHGIIFFVKDYQMLKYVPRETYFKVVADKALESELSFSNTYIYYDSIDERWTINPSSNFLAIKTGGTFNLDFIYDLEILSLYHYPCFVFYNHNVVDNQNDTENNPNVKIYYNSLIFNYATMDNRYIIVPEGENYWDTGFDTDFSFYDLDDNENTIDGGSGSVGFVVNHDTDIDTYYANGLQYFKDKIITFFDYITDFFNTMPQVIRYTFILSFLLVIGVVVFKILL